MKQSAQKGLKKLQLKSKTICRFEKIEPAKGRQIKGGDDNLVALSLANHCPITNTKTT
jgi:hypothetical protein